MTLFPLKNKPENHSYS